MKISTKITVLLAITLIFSLNIFATGFDFEEEQYIDDIPFDIEKVEAQARYQQALSVDFSLNEEEYIDDIPYSPNYMASLRLYSMAASEIFSFEEETYIDDIPFLVAHPFVLNYGK